MIPEDRYRVQQIILRLGNFTASEVQSLTDLQPEEVIEDLLKHDALNVRQLSPSHVKRFTITKKGFDYLLERQRLTYLELKK